MQRQTYRGEFRFSHINEGYVQAETMRVAGWNVTATFELRGSDWLLIVVGEV